MTTKPKIIILIIAIVIVGGFLIYKFPLVETEKRKNLEQETEEQKNIETEEQKDQVPEITIIEQPDGSKIVKNEKEGFEVIAPKNWEVYSTEDTEYIDIQNFKKPLEGGYSGIGGEGCVATINVDENFSFSSVKEWADQECFKDLDCEKATVEIVKIDNTEWNKVAFWGSFLGTGEYTFYLLKDKKLYGIDWKCSDEIEEQRNEENLKALISTMKF